MHKERNTSKKILKRIINFLFVGAVLVLLFSPDAKAWFLKQLLSTGLFKAEIKKGNTASSSGINLSFQDEKGNIVSTSELQGKVVFINFWATWCPPCRAEMPSLNRLYEQLKDDESFIFLFVNEDEDVEKAKAFLRDNHYSFPFNQTIGVVPGEIFSGTLPTTVVLNKDGKLVMKHEGMANYNSTEFIKELYSLL